MRCRQVQKYLHAYHDAELPAGVCEAVAGHLRTCAGCRQALTRLEQLADLLHTARASPVPPGFADRVLARARSLAEAAPQGLGARRTFFGSWIAAPTAVRAAAAIVVGIGLAGGTVMGWQTGRRTAAPPAADDPVVVYNLDYLGGTPEGSLPGAYLTLVASSPVPGE